MTNMDLSNASSYDLQKFNLGSYLRHRAMEGFSGASDGMEHVGVSLSRAIETAQKTIQEVSVILDHPELWAELEAELTTAMSAQGINEWEYDKMRPIIEGFVSQRIDKKS